MPVDQETLAQIKYLIKPLSLTEAFHRVNNVIPENQIVVTVTADTTVAAAFEIMKDQGFSQLPIMQGRHVLGLFSYRSFARKSARLPKDKVQPLALTVYDFIETPQYCRIDEDVSRIIALLEKEDAVLIGDPNHLQAIVTPSDVLAHLYAFSTPFVLIAEIEQSLRKLIAFCLTPEELHGCAQKSLIEKYKKTEEVPTQLEEMTFDDYCGMIRHGEIWPKFEKVFGQGPMKRTLTRTKLEEVGVLRNDVFHFKRKLDETDIQLLSDHRDWMLSIATKVEETVKQESNGAA